MDLARLGGPLSSDQIGEMTAVETLGAIVQLVREVDVSDLGDVLASLLDDTEREDLVGWLEPDTVATYTPTGKDPDDTSDGVGTEDDVPGS